MSKITRTTVRDADCAIAQRVPFVAASMSGEIVGAYGVSSYGRLPSEYVTMLETDAPTYVVFSYGTPIGWVAANGTRVVPDVSYSVTTAKHQGRARMGLDVDRMARRGQRVERSA